VGWQTLEAVEVTLAAEPSLELLDVDRALDDLAAATGPGSRQQRLGLLDEGPAASTVTSSCSTARRWRCGPTVAPEAFQDSMRRAAVLRPFFFDLLEIGGVDLLDAPLVERRERLARLVPEPCRVPGVIAVGRERVAAALTQALEQGHEGVMVKDPASAYEAGRRGAAWRKLKPVHTLDLAVLAAEWGSGPAVEPDLGGGASGS
jgi:ATP-dependent DNA ligase